MVLEQIANLSLGVIRVLSSSLSRTANNLALIAQLVEHRFCKPVVPCSNHGGGTSNMKFNVVTRIQWQHPADPKQQFRLRFEMVLFFMRPDIWNKSKHYYVKYINDTTFERPWTDQESAEKYIQNQKLLAKKYGGKIVSYEIRNVD